MATLSELVTKVRRLVDEEDVDNTHFTDEEIVSYLNQAIEFLGTSTEWALQTSIASTIEDQALYTLPDDFISLVDVYLDGNPLTLLERKELTSISRTWQSAESGTPQYVYKSDNAVIGLWPPPNEENADLVLQVQYIQVPSTISQDSDVPDLHSSLQLCLPFYAAFLCEYKQGNDKKADLNFKLYENHKNQLLSKIQGFSEDIRRFRWPR